jgi:sugar-specific transcriptional regulator TrmB
MEKQDHLTTLLSRFGLKEPEACVYLAALELGPSSVLSLARATDIKRGTVYEIVDRLVDRGLLKIAKDGKRRSFIAEDPQSLTDSLTESIQQLTAVLPQLLALQQQNVRKPTITYYDGEEEIWHIYRDTLTSGGPILSFTSVIGVYDLLEPKRIERYIRERVEKKIPVRIIAVDSKESREWMQRGSDELRDIRLVPRESALFSADVEIYGSKVAIISFKQGLFGLVIDNEQIAQMFRAAFELMWQAAIKPKSTL